MLEIQHLNSEAGTQDCNLQNWHEKRNQLTKPISWSC